MKLNPIPLSLALMVGGMSGALAQGTTAFTYQGKLNVGTNAANGLYDFRVAIFDAATNGNAVSGVLTNAATPVTNGLFTVTLDFGSGVFTGAARWLDIAVRTNGSGAFTGLTPRPALTPVPYSLFASNTATLGGQSPSYYAPASGSGTYVAKSGDAMTGLLNLPANGLAAGGNQLVLTGGKVGIGTSSPEAHFHVTQPGPGWAIFGPGWNGGQAYDDGDQRVHIGAWNGRPRLSMDWINHGGYLIEIETNDASGSLTFSEGVDGQGGECMRIQRWSGHVGIGTTNPEAHLHVDQPAPGGDALVAMFGPGWNNGNAYNTGDQRVGITAWNGNPGFSLARHNVRGYLIDVDSSGSLSFKDGYNGSGGVRMRIDSTGNVGIGVTSPSAKLDVDGTIAVRGNLNIVSRTDGSTIVALGEGLDYAEGFDVAEAATPEPGTVLVIDAEHAGKLAVSHEAYDRTVAGIVAGGQGLGSAVRAGVGRFDCDVALAGRVYCNVDGTFGAVAPGDLLTTSSTPGYAMVVKDMARAQGAILGKAMQKLAQGEKGQILVLVTLQ